MSIDSTWCMWNHENNTFQLVDTYDKILQVSCVVRKNFMALEIKHEIVMLQSAHFTQQFYTSFCIYVFGIKGVTKSYCHGWLRQDYYLHRISTVGNASVKLATSSEKLSSNMRKIRRFRSSCACATSHPGICSPMMHSIESKNSISGDADQAYCADTSTYLDLRRLNLPEA